MYVSVTGWGSLEHPALWEALLIIEIPGCMGTRIPGVYLKGLWDKYFVLGGKEAYSSLASCVVLKNKIKNKTKQKNSWLCLPLEWRYPARFACSMIHFAQIKLPQGKAIGSFIVFNPKCLIQHLQEGLEIGGHTKYLMSTKKLIFVRHDGPYFLLRKKEFISSYTFT